MVLDEFRPSVIVSVPTSIVLPACGPSVISTTYLGPAPATGRTSFSSMVVTSTVAPSSSAETVNGASKVNANLPMVIVSPAFMVWVETLVPFSFVPLREPRSMSRKFSPSFSILQCWRDASESFTWMMFAEERPMVVTSSTSSCSLVSPLESLIMSFAMVPSEESPPFGGPAPAPAGGGHTSPHPQTQEGPGP